jgi:hypothetical protein
LIGAAIASFVYRRTLVKPFSRSLEGHAPVAAAKAAIRAGRFLDGHICLFYTSHRYCIATRSFCCHITRSGKVSHRAVALRNIGAFELRFARPERRLAFLADRMRALRAKSRLTLTKGRRRTMTADARPNTAPRQEEEIK